METPLCDFVRAYAARGGLRLHMPGHKGAGPLGVEALDITEVAGADELYRARGVIRQSEENAARLFGTARTLYSAEGSSLCIRAMLYLALMNARKRGLPARLLAGRNAHKTLMTAAALLDIDIDWLFPADGGLLACPIAPDTLEAALRGRRYMAVYVTSPDYLGNMLDIAAISGVCRRFGVPLLVDNAHGAYLRFLPEDRHPITLGADMCCDSAHKTLPCLTGAAYLHVGPGAPGCFAAQAEQALSLFASTSPSYLIMQSLDAANRALAEGFPKELADCADRMEQVRRRLRDYGYAVVSNEPMKITLAPKSLGYTGDALHDLLRERNIEGEFSDPDYLVLMPAPRMGDDAPERLERALLRVPKRPAIDTAPPRLPVPERALSVREAMLSPQREVRAREAAGRVLADANVGCPPAVPILMAGERIDEDALRCFRYYGRETCRVIDEEEGTP